MDPRGHAHAVWVADDDSGDVLMMARRQAPGTFSDTGVYPGIEEARIAVNAQGQAVLIRAVQTGTGSGVNLDAVLFH
jgi:hypothetical protein